MPKAPLAIQQETEVLETVSHQDGGPSDSYVGLWRYSGGSAIEKHSLRFLYRHFETHTLDTTHHACHRCLGLGRYIHPAFPGSHNE